MKVILQVLEDGYLSIAVVVRSVYVVKKTKPVIVCRVAFTPFNGVYDIVVSLHRCRVALWPSLYGQVVGRFGKK